MKIMNSKIIVFLLAAIAFVACEGSKEKEYVPGKEKDQEGQVVEEGERQYYFDGTYYHDLPLEGWETETMARTNLMKDIQWTPISKLPKSDNTYGVYYPAGQLVTGIPYSNVSGTLGYLGRDVSFYTFLSSLRNPKGKMFTTDYRTTTSYDSKSSFYGSACSAMVSYAWGLPATYLTNNVYFDQVKGIIDKKESQDIQDLKLFDIYCWAKTSGGHMAMVYDIARDKSGKIQQITIFESVHPVSKTTVYTPATLKTKMASFAEPAYFYEYNHADYYGKVEPVRFGEQSLAELDTNVPTSLCVDRGDKVTLRYGSTVTINILSSGYTALELYKDDNLYDTKTLSTTDDVTLSGLPVGMYKARLTTEGKSSEYTYFEIGNINYGVSSANGLLTVSCSTNTSVPQYVLLDDGSGLRRMLYKGVGSLWHYKGDTVSSTTSCTVYFAGKYGSYKGATNAIIRQ